MNSTLLLCYKLIYTRSLTVGAYKRNTTLGVNPRKKMLLKLLRVLTFA